uniref:dihydrodipicolinate synthase family protein n=1 Tax=Agathobacter sp. TaxID=2021311 RepID=UPI003FF08430
MKIKALILKCWSTWWKDKLQDIPQNQLSYEKLIEKLFTEVNPIPVKAALNMMGMDVGPVRLPLTELEETHKNELKRAMSEVGIRSL